MKKLWIIIIVILTNQNLKSEELSFTNQLNLIDNSKIEYLSNQYEYLIDSGMEILIPRPNKDKLSLYHLATFKDLLDFDLENKNGCRIMWGYDLPLSKKEEYCNKKTISELGKYKNVASINNNRLLNRMFVGANFNNSHKNIDKLKRSLEVVRTNIIKKLKKLKKKHKILGSMAYFEVLVSEIIKIPYYKTESLNDLLLARDVFRGILNIPINASADHAINFFYNYPFDCSYRNEKYSYSDETTQVNEKPFIGCNTREALSAVARNNQMDMSLRKFYFFMALNHNIELTEDLIAQLQKTENEKLEKETALLDTTLNKVNDTINSSMEENLNQVFNNMENITKNSSEIFSAFDHWGDLGPTIDLGNGKGLNLLTGRVGRYKKFGE